MEYAVVAINGGIDAVVVNVILQSTEAPGSSVNMVVPMGNAGDYVVGDKYNVTLAKK